MASAANDIEVYALARHIKEPDDAVEALLEAPTVKQRPYVRSFLAELIELVEDAHEQGFQTGPLVAAQRKERLALSQLAIRVSNQTAPEIGSGGLCEAIWRTRLTELMDT